MWTSTAKAGTRRRVGSGLQCTAQRDLPATTLLSAGREALRTVEPVDGRLGQSRPTSEFSYRTAFPGPAPDTGHLLALHACRGTDGVVHLDWWYDIRSFDRSTVEELAGQFPLALIELASEAGPAAATADLRWSVRSLESRIGIDPAITGEPSEERPRIRSRAK